MTFYDTLKANQKMIKNTYYGKMLKPGIYKFRLSERGSGKIDALAEIIERQRELIKHYTNENIEYASICYDQALELAECKGLHRIIFDRIEQLLHCNRTCIGGNYYYDAIQVNKGFKELKEKYTYPKDSEPSEKQ